MATGAFEGDDESRAQALGALVERGRGEKEIAEREARAAVQVALDGGIKGVIGGHCCACGAARRGAARGGGIRERRGGWGEKRRLCAQVVCVCVCV